MEGIKCGYQKVIFEHNTKFAGIYARQAESLVEIYKLFSEMDRKTQAYISDVKYYPANSTQESMRVQDENQSNEAIDSINAFNRYLSENEILFPRDLTQKLRDCGQQIKTLHFTYARHISNVGRVSISESYRQGVLDNYEKIREQFPVLTEELQMRFRDLLGVNDNVG